jgi:hypothetical protein
LLLQHSKVGVGITSKASAECSRTTPPVEACAEVSPAVLADTAEVAGGGWVQAGRRRRDQPHLAAQDGRGRGRLAPGGATLVIALRAEQLLEIVFDARQIRDGVAVEQARSVAARDLGEVADGSSQVAPAARWRVIAARRPSKRRRTRAALWPSSLPRMCAARCTQP